MKICFDTETELIGSTFGLAPPLIVCGFCFVQERDGELERLIECLIALFPDQDLSDPMSRSIYIDLCEDSQDLTLTLVSNKQDTIKIMKWLLDNTSFEFIVHNAPFDLAVLCAADTSIIPSIFKGLDDKRFNCTYLRQMMLTIKDGGSLVATRFGLKDLVKKFIGIDLEKNQDVRTSFSNVKDKPIREWPPEYMTYLLGDIHYLYTIYQCQENDKESYVRYDNQNYDSLKNSFERVRSAFALYLVSCRGLKVDTDAVLRMKDTLEPELHAIEHQLVEAGFAEYKKKPDGKSSLIRQNKKAIQKYLEDNGRAVLTQKGNIETTTDALKGCGHPALEALADFGAKKTVLSTYVPALMEANASPAKVLHPKFFPFSETGRVNGRDPNLLNLPRSGGVRDCFVPRDGYCFVFSDYDAAEMRTFAQALLDIVKESKLAEMYNSDPDFDPHSYLAAQYLKIPYEEAIMLKSKSDKPFKKIRQLMKAANFGFLGGSSAKTFLSFAEGYGITDITLADAERLRNFYLSVFPEVRKYFAWISSQIQGNPMGEVTIRLKRSGRIAGNRRYTQACNVFVQGVAADGALRSLYEITRDCFNPNSVFWGCRPVLFIHDEIIVEAPIHKAPQVAKEVQSYMQRCMQYFTPNVPSTCSPALALRWYKDAEPVYDEQGNLKIWEPKK